MPKWTGTVFFAPKLEASRWQGLIGDPAKAIKTFTNWNKASLSEKASANLVARNAGEKLAMYIGLLALNAGVLAAIDSDDEINFTLLKRIGKGSINHVCSETQITAALNYYDGL
jgi:hypothetical protein